MKRRDLLGVGFASGLFPGIIYGQSTAPRVVIVGGGFAGASCARALKKAEPRIAVTLVESSATFTACPFSNAVIAGLRDLKAQQFTYEKVAADGIVLARTTATAVDPKARSVTLADGSRLPYDRLVLAPGSTSAGTACPATTSSPSTACRTLGAPARRPSCCAASSKRWRTAGWW
jgi:NADPH-dependent 2,4-dienoyl-CoA reductase/sulfur reductase-like enzyme